MDGISILSAVLLDYILYKQDLRCFSVYLSFMSKIVFQFPHSGSCPVNPIIKDVPISGE